MRVVLTNSVGIDNEGYSIIYSPSRWSGGVSDKSRWFAYYPWELAYLSSLLKERTDHSITLVDGCYHRMNAQTLTHALCSLDPDILIMELCSRTFSCNLEVALSVKKQCGCRIVLVGQHASAFPDVCLQYGIDYVICGEYEMSVLALLQGNPVDTIDGLYPNRKQKLIDIRQLPWPEDHDIRRIDYATPGEPSSEYREIQCYATRGCLGQCSFCVARHLYYGCANHRVRDPYDVVAEIRALKSKYPSMEGVFFDEEAHNQNPSFFVSLLDALIQAYMSDLKYEAMCDLRFIRREFMTKMRSAGYYKIRFGLESACADIRQSIGKGIHNLWIFHTLRALKDVGIKTYGTFMMGIPGASMVKDEYTISFITRLINEQLIDHVQISICTPQPGTPLYEQAKKNGWLRDVPFTEFDGERVSVLHYPHYSADQIVAMKSKAYTLRDHYFFKRHIYDKSFFSWIYQSLQKKGLLNTAHSGVKRLIKECSVAWMYRS